MEQLTLDISGMSCSHCVGRVTNALKSVAGVEVKDVAIGSATVAFDPGATSPQQIADAVTNAGYDSHPTAQIV